jgi:DNA-binding NtrC family response regulator
LNRRQKPTFREDLYHRLNVIAIIYRLCGRERRILDPGELLPPTVLVRSEKEFHGNRREREKNSGLPVAGNVRELANVIERAVVLGDGRYYSPSSSVSHWRATEEQVEELSYHDAINTYRRELIVTALATAQGIALRPQALGLQNSSAENHESFRN